LGVIFDIDGVLVDSRAAHLRSWLLLAEELGAEITESDFASTFGRTSRDIISELLGMTDPDNVRKLDDRKEALYRNIIRGAVPVMPGAREAVQRLHAAGFTLGVGSSGPPENVTLVCDGLDLTPLLSATVTGRDVARGKPDPQVFELAARRMNLDPARCVVVEDAPAGIEAARRAGMPSIGLTSTHSPKALAAADRVIEHLDELSPEIIRDCCQ
jgi:beta-phosphoglucomutase